MSDRLRKNNLLLIGLSFLCTLQAEIPLTVIPDVAPEQSQVQGQDSGDSVWIAVPTPGVSQQQVPPQQPSYIQPAPTTYETTSQPVSQPVTWQALAPRTIPQQMPSTPAPVGTQQPSAKPMPQPSPTVAPPPQQMPTAQPVVAQPIQTTVQPQPGVVVAQDSPMLRRLTPGALVTLTSMAYMKLLRVENGYVRATGIDKNDANCQFMVDKSADNAIGFKCPRYSNQYIAADKSTQLVSVRGNALTNETKWALRPQDQASATLQNFASTGLMTVNDPNDTTQWHLGRVWTAYLGPSMPTTPDVISGAQLIRIDLLLSQRGSLLSALPATDQFFKQYPAGTVVLLRSFKTGRYAQIEDNMYVRSSGTNNNSQLAWWQVLQQGNLIGFKSLAPATTALGNNLSSNATTFEVACNTMLFNDPAAGGTEQWEVYRSFSGDYWFRNVASGGCLSARDPRDPIDAWAMNGRLWTRDETGSPAINGDKERFTVELVPVNTAQPQQYTANGLCGSYVAWWRLPEDGKGSITFTAVAQADIHIALSSDSKITDQMYNIVIGGGGNTYSAVFKGFAGAEILVPRPATLIPQPGAACTITLTVDKGTKTISITGASAPIQFQDPAFPNNVKYVGLSCGMLPVAYSNIRVSSLKK